MTHMAAPVPPLAACQALWALAGLDAHAAPAVDLPDDNAPGMPSSFAIATALQASLGAAAAAAAEIGRQRGGPAQRVQVAAADVLQEARSVFTLDGRAPELWDPIAGLYPCGDGGHVRLHTNFAHHRDGLLRLLGLATGPGTARSAVAQALQRWRALDLEQAAADAGLVAAAARRFADWDVHPQGLAVAAQPLLALRRHGDAAPPRGPALPAGARPLQGLRVLDLTRILAGPVAGRTLAAYGADVLLVNGPQLPNIEAIADTSRGKRSAHVDLKTDAGRDTLRALVRDADVLLQAYRPGALAALGFGPDDLWRLNPSLVVAGLSAYGDTGPWAGRRGFDSLVQTATGFNHAEAEACGSAEPRALPLQALDYGAGFLLAFGALAACLRRTAEGGGWQVDVTLSRTGLWLRSLGRVQPAVDVRLPDPAAWMETTDSGFGRLCAVRHAARFSHTPPGWALPSMPPGSHPPAWLPR